MWATRPGPSFLQHPRAGFALLGPAMTTPQTYPRLLLLVLQASTQKPLRLPDVSSSETSAVYRSLIYLFVYLLVAVSPPRMLAPGKKKPHLLHSLLVPQHLAQSLVNIYIFLNKFIHFIYLSLAVLDLHCYAWAFSLVAESGGLLFVAVCRLLIAVASLVGEHGL